MPDLLLAVQVQIESVPRLKSDLLRMFQTLIYGCQTSSKNTAVFKIRAYEQAMSTIKSYPSSECHDETKLKQWFELNHCSLGSIWNKVDEFIRTGRIVEAEQWSKEPIVQALYQLTSIYGIGPAKVHELYQKYQLTTLQQLKHKLQTDPKCINEKQKLGVLFHDELQQKIPRVEMMAYENLIQTVAKTISPQLIISINGSYRRGLSQSGDIDVLVTSKDGKETDYRSQLKQQLLQKGHIVATLADGNHKFMGIIRLHQKAIARHIDLIETKLEQFPFAQLYFTGSAAFNVLMRNQALQKGYSMNEYGITHRLTKQPVSEAEIQAKMKKPRFETEEDVFQFLDMVYSSPQDREITW